MALPALVLVHGGAHAGDCGESDPTRHARQRPRTWILTLRDRTHNVRTQFAGVEAIGGVQKLIPIDTCHGVMVSEPKRLAEILIERCRRYS